MPLEYSEQPHNEAVIKITNCADCRFHKVLPNPDPDDWFCDDDVRVYCTQAKKNVTTACRPYKVRDESDVPSWCPLLATPNQPST